MSKRTERRLILITLLAAFAPCVNAQRFVSSPRFAPRANGAAFSHSGFGRAQRGSFLFPLAVGDSYPVYADYLSTGYPVASQPPLIILQASPALPASERTSPPVQPLMIELQGDRYVRVSGPGDTGTETVDRIAGSNAPLTSTPATKPTTAPEPPPALLIFRDGHREELSDYTIADGILYTHANLYIDGSWTRKIGLSSLNLAETIEANRSRPVNFRIPSSPNEVIVRP